MVGNIFDEDINLHSYLTEHGYHLLGYIKKQDGILGTFLMLFGYLYSFVDTKEVFTEGEGLGFVTLIDPRDTSTQFEGIYKKGKHQLVDKFVPQINISAYI